MSYKRVGDSRPSCRTFQASGRKREEKVHGKTASRSNQSILKEITPEYLLEGLLLKLKIQYFGHLVQEPTH